MAMVKEMNRTIIYYTSNHLDVTNPLFLRNTKKQLAKAIGDLPLIVVSHKPVEKFNSGGFTNLVAGRDYELHKEGRHHLNIYWQMLVGTKEAKTKYVAMAEDDILYSESHFHSKQIIHDLESLPETFIYDMNKVSLFTWTNPPIFSFRSKRKVVNQLLCEKDYLVSSMEERFKRVADFVKAGNEEERILKFFGDPGRYEKQLKVSPRNSYESFSQSPSIVFSHPQAFGFLSQGTRKRHGDIKIVELDKWGRAEDIMKLWGKEETR